MFGYRSDGKKIKDLPPIFKIMPCVMPERVDSQVYFKQDIALKSLDEYIESKGRRRNKNFLYEYCLCSDCKNNRRETKFK